MTEAKQTVRVWQKQLSIQATHVDARPGTVSYRVSVGDIVRLAPHCDLWMRGAKQAEIRRIYTHGGAVTLRVRPIAAGAAQKRLHTIFAHHVLVGES